MNYKTPGVYIEELSLLPPTISQVQTAIPAFIGYTKEAIDDDGNSVSTFPYIKRIKSLLEYEQYFGKTYSQAIEIILKNNQIDSLNLTASKYKMYYAMQLFYGNGGGSCYIVSTGKQKETPAITPADFTNALEALKKKDEPTLLLGPDAINLTTGNYHTFLKNMLSQCANLQDRFSIMDIYDGAENSDANVLAFRNGIGANSLRYGACYTPYLQTTLNYFYHDGSVNFDTSDASNSTKIKKIGSNKLADVKALLNAAAYKIIVTNQKNIAGSAGDATTAKAAAIKAAQAAIEGAKAVLDAAKLTESPNPATDAEAALIGAQTALSKTKLIDITDPDALTNSQAEAVLAETAIKKAITASLTANSLVLADISDIQEVFTNQLEIDIKALISQQLVVMPPSSAIAGVYAAVDRDRGVWKAPANVSLNQVIAPTVKINHTDQAILNDHPTGKSINAIRSFTGKGIMVWGARTLAGNSGEWRYISVRRFFNMAEESIKKATEAFVFEPNDANTWLRVRAMIENFLNLQWRAGALAGAVPEQAYYVRVGLGETMVPADINAGMMNVEIGMAVVRPAEFIILKFSHKMQEV